MCVIFFLTGAIFFVMWQIGKREHFENGLMVKEWETTSKLPEGTFFNKKKPNQETQIPTIRESSFM